MGVKYAMRKITSKEEADKKRKRNQLIVGMILVLVMVFSTLGYAFMGNKDDNEQNTVSYNGFEFNGYAGYWVLDIGNQQFSFKYNPKEVERINVENLSTLENYFQIPLYIESGNQEADYEIYRNLDKFVLRSQYACLEGQNCSDTNLPIKTCKDNFVIIKEASTPSIIQNQSCVVISGPQENLTKITDEFLFKIIGVD